MSELLSSPDSEDSLYLAQIEDIPVWRPLMQGDVLDAIEIPGLDDGPGPAMVLAHACTMRRGSMLRERIAFCRVRSHNPVPFAAWTKRHFDIFPLPGLEIAGSSVAADFTQVGSVQSSAAEVVPRLACLSEEGLVLLQQRHIHHYTRVAVDLPTLRNTVSPAFTEIDLQEEWLGAAISVVGDDPWREIADREARAYQDFLDTGDPDTYRDKLKDAGKAAGVRRAVAVEIKRRFGTT